MTRIKLLINMFYFLPKNSSLFLYNKFFINEGKELLVNFNGIISNVRHLGKIVEIK